MKKKIIILLIVAVLAGVGGFTVYKKNQSEKLKSVVTVSPYEIEKKSIEELVKAKGKVGAKEIKKIYVATSQKIAKVNYKIGDLIEKGDVLIEFDDSDRNSLIREINMLNLDLDNEKLNLAMLNQPINNIEVMGKEKEIREIKSKLNSLTEELNLLNYQKENIKTKHERALKSFESKERLFELGGISRNDLNSEEYGKLSLEEELRGKNIEISSKKIELENYKQTLQYEKNNYTTLVNNHEQEKFNRATNIRISENNIKKLEIQLSEKEENLSKLKENIISSFSGSILAQIAEKNMLVDTERALMELADTSSKIIETEIATYNISKVKMGDKVKIKSESTDENYYLGEISKIQNIASSAEGQGYSENVVKVEIAVIDENFGLKPGYDVNLEIVTNKKEDTFVVPVISLVYEEDKKYIYKLDDDVAKKVEVQTGLENINEAEILVKGTDIKESDIIIENPSAELQDNDIVQVEEQEEKS